MVSRLIKFILPAAIGIALGLLYGWILNPVQYVDITPEILRVDFRTDYVLMTAEAFHVEHDPELAAYRLGLLGSAPPGQLVAGALEFARQQSFTSEELSLLQDLLTAMQTLPEAGVP